MSKIGRSRSEVVTATGALDGFSTPGEFVELQLVTSAFGGTTPTLDLVVEWSNDGGATWSTITPADSNETITQFTGNTDALYRFVAKGAMMRLNATIGGTAGPTFTLATHISVDA